IGGSAMLCIDATGAGSMSYQWRNGNSPLADDNRLTGTATRCLTIRSVAGSDASGNYNCVVTCSCGSSVSNGAALVVHPAISITTRPGSRSLCAGSTAMLCVTAAGEPPLTYQWRRGTAQLMDDIHIVGAATNCLTINLAGISDAAAN